MKLYTIIIIALSLLLFSCSDVVSTDESISVEQNLNTDSLAIENKEIQNMELIDERDDHTLSNYDEVSSRHLHLDIEVKFDTKTIVGSVTHTIENLTGSDHVIFDTKALNISKVELNDGKEAQFKMGEVDELLGTPLVVSIDENTTKVTIYYETTEKTEALDWLIPSQTAGKEQPFMYTQGQSIFTRSWIPLQGTVALRITYSAKVKVPKNLMAVMSASNPVHKNDEGIYEFNMPQPIPCYLLALAVGDLEFAPIDQRTGVYTEPSMLASCVYELGDMGTMVNEAEKLYGAYQWERFDVIVLPPSFPFGGMENPRLTFATPTIIAGDRSLVSLIAHELAHSWSGNLVTNSSWNDFWLNEGFTVYFERRIMEAIYGKDYTDMLALLGYQDLLETLETATPDMQRLKLQLKSQHPDDGMTDIAYEKGYFFLRLLEEQVGRDNFDAFLMEYFDSHKFQTITTEKFLVYLNEKLIVPRNIDLNIEEWVYEPGLPENCPKVVSKNFNAVDANMVQFYETNDISKLIDTDKWSTHEWLHFIRNLKAETTVEQMTMLDDAFHFTQSGNSEIAAIWFQRSINIGYDKIDKELKAFLMKIGRRKFLMPLYTALAATPEGKEKAIAIFKEARPNYHYVSYNSINQLLGVNF